MQVSVAQIKAKFTAIARQAALGEEVIITTRGKPAYRLLAIVETPQRQPFPDVTALAMQSRPTWLQIQRAQIQRTRIKAVRTALSPTGAPTTGGFEFGHPDAETLC